MTVLASGKASAEQGREAALAKPFVLAGWTVRPALNRLQHNEVGERHLEPRLMKLLCYLAANQGEVLSRDELVAELWPQVIVNENSLTRAISELRKHLETPSGQARKLIQTVPKRGYLLSEPARIPAPTPSQQASVSYDTPSTHRTSSEPGAGTWHLLQHPLVAAATAATLSLCLTLVTSFDFGRTGPSNSPVLATLQDEVVGLETPLYGAEVSLSAAWASAETAVGSIDKPAIAADGQRFAFIKHDINGSAIYLGELDSNEDPVSIYIGAYKISNLTWSPLGDALLFVREPSMTTAALFDTHNEGPESQRELLSLDLQTLEISKLIEDSSEQEEDEAPVSSLTYQPTSEQPSTAIAAVIEPV